MEAGEWSIYRKIRNDLTHTYPEEKEALLEAINAAVAIITTLEQTYQKMRRFCQDKLSND